MSNLWFTSLLDNVHHFLYLQEFGWDQTGPVSLWGEKTWRDSEDVMYHIWLWHDKLQYALDKKEARESSGVDWENEHRFKLCYLWQLLSKSFHHDWGWVQQHSVPPGQGSDSRRFSSLLPCWTKWLETVEQLHKTLHRQQVTMWSQWHPSFLTTCKITSIGFLHIVNTSILFMMLNHSQ